MPTLDWLDRERAMRRADEVPYRLLEHVSTHGDPAGGDGRILVVQYKGTHLRTVPGEIEKDQVGRLWAAKSGGKCLFLMAFENEQGRGVRGRLMR